MNFKIILEYFGIIRNNSESIYKFIPVSKESLEKSKKWLEGEIIISII